MLTIRSSKVLPFGVFATATVSALSLAVPQLAVAHSAAHHAAGPKIPAGSLVQLPAPHACIADQYTHGCGGPPIIGATTNIGQEWEVAVTPDGNNVYTANNGSVQEFRRHPDGSLTQLRSPNACVSFNGKAKGCTVNKTHLTNTPTGIAANNKNVYVTDGYDGAVIEFARTGNGSLKELGCISQLAGKCGTTIDHGLTGGAGPTTVVISPDNKNVYVATGATDGGDIAEFRRAASGRLTQLAPPNDCISAVTDASQCGTQGPVDFNQTIDVTISPDGKNVYVPMHANQTIVELTRGAGGALSYLNCLTSNIAASDGCSHLAKGLDRADGIAVSPNGKYAYVVAGMSSDHGSIVQLRRGAGGVLTEIGCIGSGPGTGCRKGTGLIGATDVVVSPNGRYVYTAEFDARSLAQFTVKGGVLKQQAKPNNCLTESDGSKQCGHRSDSGLYGLNGLAVSPNGKNVYVAAQNSLGEFGLGKRLTVSISGSGKGHVAGPTVSCTTSCSRAVAVGVTLILHAHPKFGATFAGWSGACHGKGRCRVKMSSARSVHAVFRH